MYHDHEPREAWTEGDALQSTCIWLKGRQLRQKTINEAIPGVRRRTILSTTKIILKQAKRKLSVHRRSPCFFFYAGQETIGLFCRARRSSLSALLECLNG